MKIYAQALLFFIRLEMMNSRSIMKHMYHELIKGLNYLKEIIVRLFTKLLTQ